MPMARMEEGREDMKRVRVRRRRGRERGERRGMRPGTVQRAVVVEDRASQLRPSCQSS
jgi:hypothetical protein